MLHLLTYLLAFVAVRGVTLTGNETCESVAAITHFDWDDLMGDDNNKPFMNYSINIDQPSLSLIIDAELEYVGKAFADDHTYGYGTTYVLDFEDFNAESDDIREPGNCQNRVSGDLSGAWTSLWVYSHTPAVAGHIDADPYLSYPPSGDYWDLTITDDCTPIQYHGSFSWSDLSQCTSSAPGTDYYTEIITDSNWINLTGVFYINLVSPLALHGDTGYYRVYQMLSAPFVIAVRNQVNLISSVGINLFTLSIIAVYKEDLEGTFKLIVLTESADFLMLSSGVLLSEPGTTGFTFTMDATALSGATCLTASMNLCSQLWEITAADVTCPPTDFSGDYGLTFTTICNPTANYTGGTDLCNNYIATYGADVALTASLSWMDEICDPEVFLITFTGTFGFYNDSNFDHELGEGDQYALGDFAYVSISIDIPAGEAYDVFNVSLDQVWVCTTSPDNEPLPPVDQSTGVGGCIGGVLDFSWHIIHDGEDVDDFPAGDVVVYPAANATMRFSFFIDSSISRVNLYVHAQVTIDLASGGARRRMRMLLQDESTASQAKHFDGSTGIGPARAEILPVDEDNIPEEVTPDTPIWITAGVCVGIANLCLFAICFAVYCYRKKGNNKTQDIINIMKAMQDNKEVKKEGIDVVVGAQMAPTKAPSYNGSQMSPVTTATPVSAENKGYPQTI